MEQRIRVMNKMKNTVRTTIPPATSSDEESIDIDFPK